METIDKEKSISVRGLTKKFGDFTAVDHISFDVAKGEIFGFLGANGAGKTTAMRILCGLSRPTAGEGTVAGFDIRTRQEDIKKHIGYMSQRFSLYPDLKVGENIELFGGIYGLNDKQIAQKRESMLERLGLEKAEKMYVRDMPLGWKQKLAFSIAMIHNPEILFLDEPTGGVDPKTMNDNISFIFYSLSARPASRVKTPSISSVPYFSLRAAGESRASMRPSTIMETLSQYSASSM